MVMVFLSEAFATGGTLRSDPMDDVAGSPAGR